jgi:hypothetical protein
VEVFVIRGTVNEVVQAMHRLGLSGDIGSGLVVGTENGAASNMGMEQVDAFLRILTDEQRATIVAIAKGANEREQLMRRIGVDSTKRIQVLLASIKRKARRILGKELRVIESIRTGDNYVYELDSKIAEMIKR